jgi:hypothetical protein
MPDKSPQQIAAEVESTQKEIHEMQRKRAKGLVKWPFNTADGLLTLVGNGVSGLKFDDATSALISLFGIIKIAALSPFVVVGKTQAAVVEVVVNTKQIYDLEAKRSLAESLLNNRKHASKTNVK